MTWLDIAIVATICLCAAYGFWKGIIRAIIGVAGLLGGLLIAGAYYRELAFKLWPDGGAWTSAAAYAIILLAVLVAAALVAALLSRLVHMTPLGIVDRALGLAAGLLVAVLGWGLLLTIAAAIIPGADEALADSALACAVMDLLASVRGLPSAEGGSV
jgi:membrane protein required for colicin V production